MHVSFYFLKVSSVYDMLPKLCEKILDLNLKILLLAEEDILQKLDPILWTYKSSSFLPHGLWKENYPERQPLLLAPVFTSVNNPDVLILLNPREFEEKEDGFLKRIIRLIDSTQEEEKSMAQSLIDSYKKNGLTVDVFEETAEGVWQKR